MRRRATACSRSHWQPPANAATQPYVVPFTVLGCAGPERRAGSLIFNIQVERPAASRHQPGLRRWRQQRRDAEERFHRALQPRHAAGERHRLDRPVPARDRQRRVADDAADRGDRSGPVLPGGGGTGHGGSVNLPIPDAIGTIAMSATAAHVALVDSQAALPAGTCSGVSGGNRLRRIRHRDLSTRVRPPRPAPATRRRSPRAVPAASIAITTAPISRSRTPLPRNSHGRASPVARRRRRCCRSIRFRATGTTSPVVGQRVSTSGVVTGLRSNGFFIQTPDAEVDADPQHVGRAVRLHRHASRARDRRTTSRLKARYRSSCRRAIRAVPSVTEIVSPVVTLVVERQLAARADGADGVRYAAGGWSGQLEKFEGMRVSIGVTDRRGAD